MPAPAWAEVVQWASGARRPAAAVIWARLREIEVHHVDLAAAYRPEDWPESFVHRLLHELSADLSGSMSLILKATDLDHSVLIGSAPDPPVVSGSGYALAAWLTGRRRGVGLTISPDQPLPTPPQWI
jgi:maleylpyruvate isomerase